jgi:hypothetical protein
MIAVMEMCYTGGYKDNNDEKKDEALCEQWRKLMEMRQ